MPVHTEETAQRGFKIFVCAGVSSIVYDLVLYTSKGMITDLSEEEKALGVRRQVVVLLYKTIPTIQKFILITFSAR